MNYVEYKNSKPKKKYSGGGESIFYFRLPETIIILTELNITYEIYEFLTLMNI
jgi:hypothetical protein